uniref:WD_REPEATS_REGION domain-containing protein n=1 Tax=Caenorhabditis japonica TaxID=281687 RepID=A0A8R1E712_CAEJA
MRQVIDEAMPSRSYNVAVGRRSTRPSVSNHQPTVAKSTYAGNGPSHLSRRAQVEMGRRTKEMVVAENSHTNTRSMNLDRVKRLTSEAQNPTEEQKLESSSKSSLCDIHCYENPILCAAWSENLIATGSADCTSKIFETAYLTIIYWNFFVIVDVSLFFR